MDDKEFEEGDVVLAVVPDENRPVMCRVLDYIHEDDEHNETEIYAEVIRDDYRLGYLSLSPEYFYDFGEILKDSDYVMMPKYVFDMYSMDEDYDINAGISYSEILEETHRHH